MVSTHLRTQWELTTSKLPWGIHSVFREAFSLAADGKIKLVHGANVHDGSPCLVNSVHSMLSEKTLTPASAFPEVVRLFDQINRELRDDGVNDHTNFVSPMAAEILLRWFAPEPPKPVENQVNEAMHTEAFAAGQYREPTDDDLAKDWLNTLKVEAAQEDFKAADEREQANRL
jgi:hypothetical protein